jgi:flagellar biosynthesis protein FliR
MSAAPVTIDAAELTAWVGRFFWPLLRVSGFMLVAPLMSAAAVPRRVRVVLSLAIAVLVAPLATVPAGLVIFSSAGLLIAVQQVVLGVSIGLVAQLVFDALALAGQTISTTMGLGFATLVDPQRSATTPVLGQFFTVLAVLTYLSLDGHLALLGALAHSFDSMPIGANMPKDILWTVAGWGARVFEAGLTISLPATVALIVVNLSLGVVSRAAPQLNLFGVGFPVTITVGFFVLLWSLDGFMGNMTRLIGDAFEAIATFATPAPHGAA